MVRYLKFRFLSHYGSEYYCTLTGIRVHGPTMLESVERELEENEETDTQEIHNENSENKVETHPQSSNELLNSVEYVHDQSNNTNKANLAFNSTQYEDGINTANVKEKEKEKEKGQEEKICSDTSTDLSDISLGFSPNNALIQPILSYENTVNGNVRSDRIDVKEIDIDGQSTEELKGETIHQISNGDTKREKVKIPAKDSSDESALSSHKGENLFEGLPFDVKDIENALDSLLKQAMHLNLDQLLHYEEPTSSPYTKKREEQEPTLQTNILQNASSNNTTNTNALSKPGLKNATLSQPNKSSAPKEESVERNHSPENENSQTVKQVDNLSFKSQDHSQSLPSISDLHKALNETRSRLNKNDASISSNMNTKNQVIEGVFKTLNKRGL